MEDFNADNTKIDAAIRAAGQNFIKLREIVTTESANIVNVSLSGIDWSEYGIVLFSCNMAGNGLGKFRPNGWNTTAYYRRIGDLNDSPSNGGVGIYYMGYPTTLTLYPCHENSNLLSGTFCGYFGGSGYLALPYSSFSSMSFSGADSGSSHAAGTRITIWGVK